MVHVVSWGRRTLISIRECHILILLRDSCNLPSDQILYFFWAQRRPGLSWPLTYDWSLSCWATEAPQSVKALIWSTKRWQYFTEYVAASGEVGDYQEPLQHWFTASYVWIKKKGLMRTCKGISKEHIVIPFCVTSLYVSF